MNPLFLAAIASAAGSGLSLLQDRPSIPRIDMSPMLKAMRIAQQIPSASTVMQTDRRQLGEQIGLMRSQISRLGQDQRLNPEAIRTIAEKAYLPMFSTYIQGMGRVYGQAINSSRARAMAAAQAATGLQQGQYQNAMLGLQEQQMQPNLFEGLALGANIGSNIANALSYGDYANEISSLFNQYFGGAI
jgi:hypothetical protein